MTEHTRIDSYDQLIDLLRVRKAERNISDAELEHRCGFTRAHVSKLLNHERGLGMMTLLPLLTVLGVDIFIAVNETSQVKFEERRDVMARTNHRKRKLRKIMREMGLKRWAGTTAEERSEIARRRAWKARWDATHESGIHVLKSEAQSGAQGGL